MESYKYYLSLPAGARLVFNNAEVVKMDPSSSYDGIDESIVVDINRGTIHHISEFVKFMELKSIGHLKRAVYDSFQKFQKQTLDTSSS